MKAFVKEKVRFNALLVTRQFKTASLLIRYEIYLAKSLAHEFMPSIELSLDSMHLFVFNLDRSFQVGLNRDPTHDSNST